MSLGDVNNNRTGGKYYPTVYSNLVFYNDTASFNFRFVLSGILEMRVVPKNASGQGFDEKNGISIFISPNKAIMLSKAISLLKEDIKNGRNANYGVCNNKKTSNIEFGYNKQGDGIQVYCTIYKYDNNGNIGDNYTFVFNNDDYIIKNFSPNDCSYDSIPVSDLPLTQIQNLLDQYAKAMTGAGAYGVEYHVGQYRYNVSSLKKMLENGGGTGSNNYLPAPQGNSIFDNGGSNSNTTSTNSFENGDLFDLE